MRSFLLTQFWITVIVLAEVAKWVAAFYLFRAWGPAILRFLGVEK